MRRDFWGLFLVLTVLLVSGLLVSGPLVVTAAAHASLVASSPSNGQTVGGSMNQIDLVFNEPVEAPRVILTGPGGGLIDSVVTQPSPNHLNITFASPLEVEGEYRVDYQLVSVDEDPLSLTLDFSYAKGADPALPVVASVVAEAGGGGIRWAIVGGLAIVVAALGLRFVRSRQALRQYSGS